MTTHCNTINNQVIPVEKKIKWFRNFFITLLNDYSHTYITEKNYKDTFQNDLKDAILKNEIEDYFKDEITKTNLSIINKTILGHKKNADLFDWMKVNNYINFFFFPYFIKFLNFKCITFEYYENTLYGGIYNYLKKKEYANKKYDYFINNYSINQSSGFDYEYSPNRYPEFLVVNLWDNNDNLANLSTIKDEPKLENIEIDKYTNTNSISTNLIDSNKKFSTILEYNGYKYYLKSCLLDNYNTTEFRKPRHTISIIWCGNKKYVYLNTYVSKSATMISTLFAKQEEPCHNLIEFNIDNLYKTKGLSLSDSDECGLFDVRGNDEKTKYCYSLLKGRRVLIYVREQEDVKNKRDKDAKDAQEKKEKEEELSLKVIDKFKDKEKKKTETEAEKKARLEKDNKDRICNIVFDYVDKIRTKIDKKDIDEKIKKEKEYITSKVKELEDKEKKYDVHKRELEKMKQDIEKMHKDNLAELKKYIDELKLKSVGVV
jgi:hypothetical protein